MNVGDIVFSVATINDERSTKLPRVFIRAGQWLKMKVFSGGEAPRVPIVHAAIAVGNNTVIESVGDGIVATNLADERPPRSGLIFTPTNTALGDAAAFAASQFFNDRENSNICGEYSCTKAMLSVIRSGPGGNDLIQRINDSVAIGHQSFCSQFVVNCYEIGNLYISANLNPPPPSIFNQRPAAMTPYELAEFCDSLGSGFRFAGFWQDGVQCQL
ncbi:hypothetical protein [Chitinolyticbacter albus]|uniref:hypothetical protein n=1 Tax=Chitinolyticbacter albus TaxID=2961951 RepID=UPI00210D3298|nr:hypothetical protein [Chitinolyticbacter albus]